MSVSIRSNTLQGDAYESFNNHDRHLHATISVFVDGPICLYSLIIGNELSSPMAKAQTLTLSLHLRTSVTISRYLRSETTSGDKCLGSLKNYGESRW